MKCRYVVILVKRPPGEEYDNKLPKVPVVVGLPNKEEYKMQETELEFKIYKKMFSRLSDAKTHVTRMSNKFPLHTYALGTVVWDDSDEQ